MLDIGWSELLVIAVILIVVVGPKDLPPMLRAFGKMSTKLRRTAGEFRAQFDEALREADLEDVGKTIADVRKFNPASVVRDAVNPLRQAGEDIRSDLRQAAATTPAAAVSTPAPMPDMPSPLPPITSELVEQANPKPAVAPVEPVAVAKAEKPKRAAGPKPAKAEPASSVPGPSKTAAKAKSAKPAVAAEAAAKAKPAAKKKSATSKKDTA